MCADKNEKLKSFTTQKCPLLTKSNENVLTLACWYGYDYFPTHNGVDSLDKIECIDGKWSLPDDMGPIQCKSVTCPPFPDFGSKIVTKCTKRDQACVTSGKYEIIEDCSCLEAVSTCRPKFIRDWNETFHEIEPERTRGTSHNEFIGAWYAIRLNLIL